MITVVTGFTRSGTSLMMQMLHRGGMDVYAENHYSYETPETMTLPRRIKWLDRVEGRAIKMLEPLEFYPPKNRAYRFILMTRKPEEQAKSQVKFMHAASPGVIKCSDNQAIQTLAASIRRDTPKAVKFLQTYTESTLIEISFESLIDDPFETACRVSDFCGGLNVKAMVEQVIRRSSDCLPYLLETVERR